MVSILEWRKMVMQVAAILLGHATLEDAAIETAVKSAMKLDRAVLKALNEEIANVTDTYQ